MTANIADLKAYIKVVVNRYFFAVIILFYGSGIAYFAVKTKRATYDFS